MKLTVTTETRDADMHIRLTGFLDESAELPEFERRIAGRVVIDCESLRMINSFGCRRWVQWIRGIDAAKGITLVRCSPATVNQMNILSGFLAPNVTVESLFVPYHCEPCGDARELLFELDAKQAVSQVEAWPEHASCPDCGSQMELDVLKARYFMFVTRKSA